jgi:dolichol-phosphate mannosyltransferase
MPLQVKSLAEWEREGITDIMSVVIPAHNEDGHIADTVEGVAAALKDANIHYEIFVINNDSQDRTENIIRPSAEPIPRCVASITTQRTARLCRASRPRRFSAVVS